MFPVFIFINILIAIFNNAQRVKNIKSGIDKQINHALWFGIYSALCVPVLFIDWRLAVACWLQHGWFFPIFYNWIALGFRNVFHLSLTSRATYDKAIVDIITWINKRLETELPYSMFVPDLLVFVTSIFFLWLY